MIRQLFCKHKCVEKKEFFERMCPGFIGVYTIRLVCKNCGLWLEHEKREDD